MRDRFQSELVGCDVRARNLASLLFEGRATLARLRGWARIQRRNEWFGRIARDEIERLARLKPTVPLQVFSYSYAAREAFDAARNQGWHTILGQIDPGPAEERIVAGLARRHPALSGPWKPGPRDYWESWRRECDVAEVIVVNSPWSRDALVGEGIDAAKIRVIPLAYEPPPTSAEFRRDYPTRFSHLRPLRLLFLGQLTLRKGMGEILEAMHLLRSEPIEFRFVGSTQMDIPGQAMQAPNSRWMGYSARSDVERHYQDSDVFLFPTHSDGFGLTQLEARAWKLPIIASRFCAPVVTHGVDGVVLTEVTAHSIAGALRDLVEHPDRLLEMSHAIVRRPEHSIEELGNRLVTATP